MSLVVGFGDNRKNTLSDMATASGGVVFESEGTDLKLEDIQVQDFGQVGEVVITKDDTLFLKGKGKDSEIKARVELIKDHIENTVSEYEKEKLQV